MQILASPDPRMLVHLKDCIDHWKEEEGKARRETRMPRIFSWGSLFPSQNVSEGLRGDTRSPEPGM